MTTVAPSTSPARRPVSPRHPVRVATDGDFELHDLLALPGTSRPRRLTDTHGMQATLRALGIEPGQPDTTGDHEATTVSTAESLLRRLETADVFRPPVEEHVATLTPEVALTWLGLAARWIDQAPEQEDLRFLNAACKLLGAVWLRHHGAPSSCSGWHDDELVAQLAGVGRLLVHTTTRLRQQLHERSARPIPSPPETREPRPLTSTSTASARTVVLAGAGSASAERLVKAATRAGASIAALCRFATPGRVPTLPSNYAEAWYPPAGVDEAPPEWSLPADLARFTATTWGETAEVLRRTQADLVLLAGMPIVPAHVLDTARLGVLNAHNGALPSYRGMDAVGWALLNNDPIVCTLHVARPAVDAGEILTSQVVPVDPLPTLRARVKATQMQLLVNASVHATATGQLPEALTQAHGGRQFYRLHPHLKRLLDTSPYGATTSPDVTRDGQVP